MEFKTSKGAFILIEVPTDAVLFVVDMGYLIFKVPNYKNWVTDAELSKPEKLEKYMKRTAGTEQYMQSALKLPPGNYKLIGLTKSCLLDKHEASQKITEEKAALIVGDNGMGCYDNYRLKKDDVYTCSTAMDSFACLMSTMSMSADKNYAVLIALP